MQNNSVTEILLKWPDRRAILEDAQVSTPTLDMVAVHRWFKRESIPIAHWDALTEGAAKRGFTINTGDFMVAHGYRDTSYKKVGAA
jgi:hypothetical protein